MESSEYCTQHSELTQSTLLSKANDSTILFSVAYRHGSSPLKGCTVAKSTGRPIKLNYACNRFK
jgi:hypothetical protein